MPTDTNPSALSIAITDTREDIASLEAGVEVLELSIPEAGTLEFRTGDQDAITGTRVQIRMDREFLAQRRSELRQLERLEARRAA